MVIETYLNYRIEEGEVTSSDHIPVIMTLSTNPICIRTEKRRDFRKANWETYKRTIEEETLRAEREMENHQEVNKDTVDQDLNKWYSIVEKAATNAIPLKVNKILTHPRTSDYLKLLLLRFKELKRAAEIHRWAARDRVEARNIQAEVTNESKRLYS